MSEWITEAGAWTLRNSLEGGLLIVLLAAVAILGRRALSPRVRTLLWAAAGLRLILPAAPSSSLSFFNLLPQAEVKAESTVPVTMPGGGALPLVGDLDLSGSPSGSGTAAAVGGVDWSLVLGLLWLAGAAAVLGLACAGHLRHARRVRRLPEPEDSRVRRLFRECLEATGLEGRGLRLAESPRAGEIAVSGFLRAKRVLVPCGVADAYPETELRGVLLHELAHVQRRDLARNWLMLGLQALHWFNPLVWWAGARLRAERELACDQIALRQLGRGARRQYGLALLRTLESGVCPPAPNPAFAPFFSHRSELKHRLTMIKSNRPPARPLFQLLALAIAAVACAGTFTSAIAADEKERASKPKRSVEKRHTEKRSTEKREIEERAPEPFKVYVNKRSVYVSGQTVRDGDLPKLVRKSRQNEVVLTAEPDLPRERVNEVRDLIREGGAAKIKIAAPESGPDGRLVAVERAKAKEGPLKVYLNRRGAYIEGKSVRGEDLPWVVRRIRKDEAVLTAEKELQHGKVTEVLELIREGGVKKVKLAVIDSNAKAGGDKKKRRKA